ncbi:filamentous haemagglutinin family protein [Methylococcus geothermalis]|uniref:Filamentous hemagglutinin N-terminal domain-containing protein n=1 Tax=Methylococcus geothermalis TaxID=2681310 RepID=A0A858Q8X0_9GAMM|nr:filamentous haemagglutinin family protein [Methylococcus geothermalis]QJD30273.1 filamentous hemagglutinin N-terminal domain-containing protein [Methylococcus geothermalis]
MTTREPASRKQNLPPTDTSLKPLASSVRTVLAGAFLAGGAAQAGSLPVPAGAFVSSGSADQSIAGNLMTINQHSDRAILNWKSFNIGAENTVQFKQPSAASIALNRIYQSDPSRIFGKLSANGQVYLLNQNGFIFGKGSQVDVNTLLVSTLNITDDTFQRGITKVIDQDGRPALVGDGKVYRVDEQGNFVLDENGNRTKIGIEFAEGSSVKTAPSGRIIAAAPSVVNKGDLSAPDGQILLIAATDKVYLQEAGSDSNLRGLLVEVGTGGEVTNIGKALAERGNVTLMGFAVNQQGRVSATTSVRVNGSVRLLAREGASVRREGDAWLVQANRTKRGSEQDDGLGTQATVTLKGGSKTSANPDMNDPSTAVDGQSQDASWIEIMGHQVRIENGAQVTSHAGKVTVTATENPANPGLANVKNDARIHVDKGAKIDVSGIKDVSVAMERNVVTVELRSNELRDSPLQRDGVLYGQKIRVDIRKGTPIADISGELERIARTVAERSTGGGTLNLVSEGDAILRRGAVLDFSGGSVAYRSGYVDTTQLLTPDGKTVDIGSADPNQTYAGIFGQVTQKFKAWNITKTWDILGPRNLGRYEQGYVEGKAAGTLDIKAAALALEAEMRGASTAGLHQREAGTQPAGGTLKIDLARSPDSTQSVIFGGASASLGVGKEEPFPQEPGKTGQPAALVLSGDKLRDSGIMHADIKTNGKVVIRSGENLTMTDGGSLALTGGEIKVDGTITAHAGEVDLSTRLTSATQGKLSGAIDLASGASIDVSGQWINDRPADATGNSGQDRSRVLVNGGTVSVKAEGDVNLAAGSRIDVSGGARRTGKNSFRAGDAGGISLEAAAVDGSDLKLKGTLEGYAFAGGKGGSLSLVSDQVILGNAADAEIAKGADPLVLNPDFFGQGGFAHYSVGSNKSGVTVTDGTNIQLSVKNRVLDPEAVRHVSGSNFLDFAQVKLLSEFSREAGELDLLLAQEVGQGGKDAAVRIGDGAVIHTDAGGRISLQSDASIFMNGTLEAAGGNVAMTVTPPAGTDPGFKADQGIWIGSGARVDVSGTALLYSDRPDHVTGKVLDGGTITLHADRGFVVADKGSELDVSGTQGRLDVPVRGPNGAISQERRQVASSGGNIEIRAAEGIQLYGKLEGRAGDGTGAAGGGLSLELNPNTRAEPDEIGLGQTPFPKVPSVISLTQSEPEGLPTVQGKAVSSDRYGQAVLGVGQVERGGFGELTLRTPGRIELARGLNLHTERSIVLDAPVLAFQPAAGATAGKVSLDSAYVALGSTQTRPGNAAPTAGNGSLRVSAGLIDLVGTTALQGFDGADLKSSGDLRLIGVRTTQQQRDFLGEFLAAGDLTLTADQLYPSTLSEFRIAVRGTSDGTLTIKQSDSNGGTVLSAGGKLTLEAPNIVQGGTVKAPLGELNFQASNRLELAAGSVTSNSAKGAIIPFGRTQGGLDWIYPLGDQNLVMTAPPEKKLVLDGAKVDIADGSVIDTRGGGDLSAFEFVPGPGGSYDLLDPASKGYQEAYAILPSFKGTTAPYDPLEFPNSGLKVGDSVYLSGGGGLKAGYYVLLPAHYALLPGAYLVTPDKNATNIVPGLDLKRADGAPIVAGYRTVSGTGIRDALWSGFAVEPGSAAQTRAEYSISSANDFFSAKAAKDEAAVPYLPRDAGSMLISAETALGLNGQVSAKAGAKGRGGRLDIDAANIAIVSEGAAGQATGNAIKLVAEKLNGLGVASIAIGGVRNTEDGTVTVDTHASNISLGQNAKLKGAEFILTAKDNITLAKGADITAEGASKDSGAPKVYKLDGDAAFLRVSSSDQADLQRSGVSGHTGSIIIGSGATLATSNSMIVDATADMDLSGKLLAQGGSVSLGASRIGLGADSSFQNGLALSQAALNALQANELRLNSGSDISLFGAVELASQHLVLRSGGLLGFDNAGQTASIKASDIRLENPLDAKTSRTGNGTGTLSLIADTIELGEGAYALKGYSNVTVEAGKAIVGSGTGTLTASADLDFSTPIVTGDRGADTRIDATGHAVGIRSSGTAQATADALGAQLSITADSIRNAGTISLKSGVVKLDALKGDVVLAAGSSIDVSGREVNIGNANVATDGGAVELSSQTGNVALESGAKLALNGSKGGELLVSAAAGGFRFEGSVDAQGAERGGRFALDVRALENKGDVGGMAGKLASAGFSDGISLRTRTGDLHLNAGDTVAARTVELAADQGSVRIDGSLKAQGDNAKLDIEAGSGLTLAASADLEAHGSAEQGGRVVLESLGEGGITVASGAHIDASATDGSANGTVNLRALRTDQDVAVAANLGSSVSGAAETTVEAVRIYDHSGTIGSADIAAWKTDTDAYMANAGAIETRLGLPGGLRAGLEIRSSGDLTLGSNGWDLVDWRYDGRPGVLTLQAGGKLSIDGKLSDGFRDDPNGIDVSGILGPGATVAVKDMLQTGSSWSYRLQAGTDVVVGSDVAVRTGTGDIDVEAGRDVILTNAGSSIYTAGRPTDTQRYGNFKNGFVAFQFYGEYPVDGGDINISAGRDVVGARTGQFFDGWLVRTGNWTESASHQGETPTAWAVAIGGPVGTSAQQGTFQQNVGALGGGNITVEAGRDVSDLSAVIATTGKQVGTVSKPNDPSDTGFNTNEVQVSGGGNLTVSAGGDVLGGTFYTGKGIGEISARGAIKGSANGLGPVLALGDSRFSLSAGQDIELGAAINPTVINSASARNFFFTYSDRSGIALESLSGDVRIQNDISGMVSAVNKLRSAKNQLSFPGASLSALSVYPASLDVAALQGDVVLERSFTTYPAAKAGFSMLAGGNITTGSVGDNVNVTQSDADPILLPGIANPAKSWEDASQRLQPFGASNLIHAQVPVHRGDSEAARIYAKGNIASVDPLLLVLPKAVDVMAGRDLFDVSLHVQHPDYAMSSITAGRDIRFTSPRNAQGNLVNLTREIQLSGPGQLWVSAGRNIDLGASEGIYTIGNTENNALADNGASISVMAGLNGNQARFDKFAEKYDPTSSRYRALLLDYMRKRTGNDGLNYADAAAAYQALPGDQQHELLLAILFDEIRASAAQAAKTGRRSDYDRGFAAIDTLFPHDGDTKYKGNLSLFFSKIHTVDGGDINLLVPGGGVNAGLAVAFAGSKAASDLGIVAQRQGAVNALVNGNFMVNQSRVFAMDGGDITIWSSNGNIDAGRGAKSAIAAPPPRITFDERGNLQVEFPPVVSGSGIRTAASTTSRPGDVFLAAPRGVVDAGEAGIGGTNVAIAATAVLGASNIQVGGTATGVPSGNVSVPVVPAGAAAAAGAATQAAMQSTVSDSEEKSEPKVADSSSLNPLKVELLGFGECSTTDIKNGSPGCT